MYNKIAWWISSFPHVAKHPVDGSSDVGATSDPRKPEATLCCRCPLLLVAFLFLVVVASNLYERWLPPCVASCSLAGLAFEAEESARRSPSLVDPSRGVFRSFVCRAFVSAHLSVLSVSTCGSGSKPGARVTTIGVTSLSLSILFVCPWSSRVSRCVSTHSHVSTNLLLQSQVRLILQGVQPMPWRSRVGIDDRFVHGCYGVQSIHWAVASGFGK